MYLIFSGREIVKLKVIVLTLLFLLVTISPYSKAATEFTPTAAQIEQFKKLPRAQQEALARQYGFDINQILGKAEKADTGGYEQSFSNIQSNEGEEQKSAEELEEKRYEPESEKLEVFGTGFFEAAKNNQLSPLPSIFLPDSYIVGPGDEFTISLYGKQSAQYDLEVDRSGRLVIPELPPVMVSGLTYKEMKGLIKQKVASEMIGVELYISAGELKTIPVMVLGEVSLPGNQIVQSMSTVTDVLIRAGGISEIGSMRQITVRRNGKVLKKLDLYDLLIYGDDSSDVILKPKDIIFVPPIGRQVSVDGLVKRPAIFELKEQESLEDAIEMAGGAAPNANLSKVLVSRYTGTGLKTVVQMDLSDKGEKQPFLLEDGDEVNIARTNNELTEAVTLIGAVSQPGNYSWQRGHTIKDIITSLKTDILPIADYDYSLILREKNLEGDIDIVQFSLAEVFQQSVSIGLEPRDVIVIFSRFNDKAEERSTIRNLAFSKAELELQEKEEQWKAYKERKFEEFIGVRDIFSEPFNDSEKESTEVEVLDDILKGEEEEIDAEQLTVFGRQMLLQPIIKKLTQQANVESQTQVVAVSGRVKYPGVYPLPVNGNIKALIQASGGLHESAYLEQAELTRFKRGGQAELSHANVNLNDALANPDAPEFRLNSKDSLNVFVMPNWQDKRVVTLLGEVQFPGTYRIKRGESLLSLIERAGGLTDFAYPEGAIFTREAIRKQEKQQLTRLQEDLRREIATKSLQKSVTDASMSYTEMSKLLKDLADVEALGRLVIDLPRVLVGEQKVELQSRDAIYLPPRQSTVSVVGEVNQASSHLFESDLSVEDYIVKSGGMRQRADEDKVYVIKANGSVEIPQSNSWFAVNGQVAQLQPGDTIVVPLDADYTDNLTLWSAGTQILYQLAVAVAAIGSL